VRVMLSSFTSKREYQRQVARITISNLATNIGF
jgi:hypothetical protein